MYRTLNGFLLYDIANEPSVRPLLGGEGEIPLLGVCEDPNNYAFEEQGLGGFIALPVYPGAYEVHTIMRPGMPPREVLRVAREFVDYMFQQTLADKLLTKVPDDNKGAGWLSKACGFQPIGHRQDAWKPGVGVTYQKLDLDEWMKACSTLVERGRDFHHMLECAKAAGSSSKDTHLEDEYHNRAVGAAVSMIRAGNTAKGLDTYNKWAVFAGYSPATLISYQPFVVDIQDAVLGVVDGEFRVLKCR